MIITSAITITITNVCIAITTITITSIIITTGIITTNNNDNNILQWNIQLKETEKRAALDYNTIVYHTMHYILYNVYYTMP